MATIMDIVNDQPLGPALDTCHDNMNGCESVLHNILDRVRGPQPPGPVGGRADNPAMPNDGHVGSANRLRDRLLNLQRGLNDLADRL